MILCMSTYLSGNRYSISCVFLLFIRKCDMKPLACSTGCGATILRKDQSTHADVCPEVSIECPFKQFGCNNGFHVRKDYADHQRDHAGQHADMAAGALAKQADTIADLNDEVRRRTTEGRLMMARLDALEAAKGGVPTKAASTELTWTVTDIERKIQAGAHLASTHVSPGFLPTLGRYDMRLQLQFTETHLGIFVAHYTGAGGSTWTPIDVSGSCIALVTPGPPSHKEDTLQAGSQILQVGGSYGFSNFVSYAELRSKYLSANGNICIRAKICLGGPRGAATLHLHAAR